MGQSTALSLNITGAAAMEDLGDRLAAVSSGGGIRIGLSGELGAGKTTLARGFLRRLGVVERVKSPTYSLVEFYEIAGKRLFHIDLYRLRDSAELVYLDLESWTARDVICLVEWPEHGADRLPAMDILLTIHLQDPSSRRVDLRAITACGESWLSAARLEQRSEDFSS